MGDQNRNHVAIQIKAKLEKAKPLFTTKCCIYRVPHEIRELNPGTYTPTVVSIGPFHHRNENLQSMKSQKLIYCQKFIERAAKLHETTSDSLVSCVQESELDIRDYYSEHIDLSPQEFVELIFVDSGFIIELLLINYFHDRKDGDAIPSNPRLVFLFIIDLILLENQLPFFILEKLYNLAFSSHTRQIDDETGYPSFMELIFHYFSDYNKLKLPPSTTTTDSIKHFTDLLRIFHLYPSNERCSRGMRGYETIPRLYCANDLNEAGVMFEVNKQSECLLNLKISGGPCLKIPEIRVDDESEILLRNMVALEQCHYLYESYITDYVAILSFLIKTGKDVDLLVKSKIVGNWLGDSDAVAKLFNGLWKNNLQVGFNSKYVTICRELNKFCEHPWNRAKATLRRDYCKTPWQKVASFAAFLLLILTITHTVFSILQVVLPQ